jgi:hypothetical protein
MTTAAASNATDMATLMTQGAELIAGDRWSRPQLLTFQRGRLQELLAYVVAESPYYRETLGPHLDRGGVRLEQLPTLPKETLVDEFDRIVTDPSLRLVDLEEDVHGPNAGDLFLDRYRAFSTSGTTGVRALIVYSEDEFRFWVAASLRLFARAGITPQTRLVAIGAPNPLHITQQLFAAFRTGRANTPQLSVLTPIDEIVEALNAYQPEVMLTYASIAALLAQEQLRGGFGFDRGTSASAARCSRKKHGAGSTKHGASSRSRSMPRRRRSTSPPALRRIAVCTSTKTLRSSRSSTNTTNPSAPAGRDTRCSSPTSSTARSL